jgi:hypothetical protein
MAEGDNRVLTGITPNLRLVEVVARWPDTEPVFVKAGIDPRTAGEKRVEALARAHGLDLNHLLRELREAAD